MAIDYGSNSIFGNQWKTAMARGDTDFANRLQARMDAMTPQDTANFDQQVGMINAKTADMGRGSDVFANGLSNSPYEYNTQGQYRTPGVMPTNDIYGRHGYAANPGQVQGNPVVGQFDPTPTIPSQANIGNIVNAASGNGTNSTSQMLQLLQQLWSQRGGYENPLDMPFPWSAEDIRRQQAQQWELQNRQGQQSYGTPYGTPYGTYGQQQYGQPYDPYGGFGSPYGQQQQYSPYGMGGLSQVFSWGNGYGSNQAQQMNSPYSQMSQASWGGYY